MLVLEVAQFLDLKLEDDMSYHLEFEELYRNFDIGQEFEDIYRDLLYLTSQSLGELL